MDWLLIITTSLLCLIGLGLIYSVLYPHKNVDSDQMSYVYLNRQLMWICFGMIALMLGLFIPFRYYETLAYVFYAVCIILLLLVFVIGSNNYPNRWISLGAMKIQPSELTKIALLFICARVLAGRGSIMRP
jgi:rod shape determining protein RodA